MQMDRVADCLIQNDLGRYASTFEEYGWDDKSLLYKMTENDIEMCIQKPGHKVKFKTALVRGMVQPSVSTQTGREGVHASVATQTDKDMECIHEAEHTTLAEKIAAHIAVYISDLISDLINVAVEKAIKGITGDTDKTLTDSVKLDSGTQKANTVACSNVNESDEFGKEHIRLKSDVHVDEICTEKVSNHPDNAEEIKGIETTKTQPTLNTCTIQGDKIVTAEETQERPLTESSDHEAMSSNSAVHSEADDENRCEAETVSEGQPEVEIESMLEDTDQESYIHDLSPTCEKDTTQDLVVATSIPSSLSAAIGSQPVNFYQTIKIAECSKKILHIEDIGKNSLNYRYAYQRRYVDDKQQLVICLLEKDMYQAFSAILRNKTIQELLHNDPTWIKALEHALKRVCMTTRDMNIVKDIVKPLNANKTIIDGSAALVYAIGAQDAECAQYIIENTKVMFWELNIKSYFVAFEKSSIDLAKFIQLFDNHAQSSEIKTKLLLYVPSAKECLHMLSLLRDNGADFHRLNGDNFNALHIACERHSGNVDVLKYLLDIGVDASQVTTNGLVPLMFALVYGPCVDTIRLLLPISPKGHKDAAGQGYFHYLMQSSRRIGNLTTLCQMLLNEGEDIDLQDARGKTPVMYFMRYFFSFLGELKNKQIKKFFCSVPLNLHLTDNNGQNVLNYLFAINVVYPRDLWIKRRKYIYKLFLKTFKVDDQLKDKNGVAPCMMA